MSLSSRKLCVVATAMVRIEEERGITAWQLVASLEAAELMDVRTDSIAPLRSLGFGFREGHANGISGPMWGA